MLRTFVIIGATCLLVGATATLISEAKTIAGIAEARILAAETVARRDLALRGYEVIAADHRPNFDCGAGAQGFEFTAIRDHRLYSGGVCARIAGDQPSRVVTLPALR